MNDEIKIKVFIKVNITNEVTAINSDIFLSDLSEWIKIDEGYGDKFALAQNNYLDKPLMSRDGTYNYLYIDGQIVERGSL